MLTVQRNIELQPYNTFGISAIASHFIEITNTQELEQLAQQPEWELPKLILGGGSNILLTKNVEGLVIKLATKGIELIGETDESVFLNVQAGENWHQFVLYSIENNWAGIENLSLIPGCVGASPMQNIGAYGVEINQVVTEVRAFHINKKEFHTFSKEECEFGYRTSIFKTKEKGNYIITDVTFELRKEPILNISYGAISSTLAEKKIEQPSIQDVSAAVIEIRQSKLPDPKEIGNSGSFFKNPIVERKELDRLQKDYPSIPFYEVGERVKIPAGWLIEQCGWKGKKVGNTGTYKNQALILVNHGGATGKEVYDHALRIKASVFEQFQIEIEPEVNLI